MKVHTPLIDKHTTNIIDTTIVSDDDANKIKTQTHALFQALLGKAHKKDIA